MDDLEIDRTLRATLSADPSPEFLARARTNIAEAPRPSMMAGWLKPVAATACAVIVAIVVGWPQETEIAPETAVPPSTPAVVVPTFSPVALAKVGRSAKTTGSPTRARAIAPEPPLPEVIVAAEDVEALRQLLVSLNEHTFVASFDETPASTPWVMTDLRAAPGDALDPSAVHNN